MKVTGSSPVLTTNNINMKIILQILELAIYPLCAVFSTWALITIASLLEDISDNTKNR